MDLSKQEVPQTTGKFVQDLVSVAPKKAWGIGQLSCERLLSVCLLQIKDLGVKAGVVLNPGTSLTAIEEVPFSSPALLFSATPFFHSCLAGNAQSLPARKLPVYHLASSYPGVHGCHC